MRTKDQGSHCGRCGEILTEQQTVPALGHDFGEWTQAKKPTCTEKGEEKNMRKLSKSIALLLVIVMIAGVLAACGKGNAPTGGTAGLDVDPATLAFPLTEKDQP